MKESSITRLTISGASFYAYHGVKSEEQTLGGKYEVDLDIYYNARDAIINDDVNLALNYEEAMFSIEEVLMNENYNLIETVANEILNLLIEKFDLIEKATVRVRKLNAPIRHIVAYIEAEQTFVRKKD